MIVNNIEVKKVLKFPSAPAFGKYKRFFPAESVAHPAKIHTDLLEYLILNYTKEGDTVLDCMCGTGSTVVLSMLNNRNAIGIDLEEKFTTWAKQAIKNVEQQQTLTPKGKGMVICGDSRKLSELLKDHEEEISSVLFFPPYGEAQKGGGIAVKGYEGKHGKDENLYLRHDRPLSDDERNISNLPTGDINSVIFSPPYANQEVGKGIRENRWDKVKDKEGFKGRKEWREGNASHYSDNPDDIGNLPVGDMDSVIFSPPYKTANKGGGLNKNPPSTFRGVLRNHSFKLSDNPNNIDNLPFADVAFFSPPYSTAGAKGDENPENYIRRARERYKLMKWQGINRPETEPGRYSGGWNNIGNLPFGIDCIVTSPPCAASLCHRGQKFKDVRDKLLSQGYSEDYIRASWSQPHQCQRWAEEAYSESDENIGNFQYDTIISSPSYSDRSEHRVGYDYQARDIERGYKPYHGFREQYEDNPENIGSLKFGAILFSPPYSNIETSQQTSKSEIERRIEKGIQGSVITEEGKYMTGWGKRQEKYSSNLHNIGNIKDFGVDAVLASPPYESSLSGINDEQRAKEFEKLQKMGYNINPNSADNKVKGTEYSNNKENIGNQKKETYLEAMKLVYEQCYLVLKQQGLLILILKNFIRKKKVVKLTDHTIRLCEGVGFKLKERLLFRLPTQSFWRRLYSQKYPEVDTSDLRYEHILIFEKEGF